MNDKEKYIYKPAKKNINAIPVWFYFPAPYKFGMSSLGYLYLYSVLDRNPLVNPERIFQDTEKTLHNVQNVELLGISYSFEFDFLGVLKAFDKYNIPYRSKNRDDKYPLVFGGGPVMTCNPEPYAEFFDFIIIGDGEEVMNKIVDVYNKYRNSTKEEKLFQLAKIEGIYVPAFYEVQYDSDDTVKKFISKKEGVSESLKRCCVKNIEKSLYTPIWIENTMFSGAFLIELSRGCPRRCNFCIASYLNLPSRYPLTESVIKAIDIGLENSNKIGLLGALIAEHPDFEKICEYISKKRDEKEFEMSVASLRADKISPFVVQTLVKCGQKSVTIAIEAGSDRLRKSINKQLTEEQILNTVKTIYENGLSAVKIYGMIGLPAETDEDIKALVDLMKKIKKENKGLKITLSVSSFVPKGHTPFQWEGREDNKTLQKKVDYLKKEFLKAKILFKSSSIKWDYVQAVLSRGDRRLVPLLEKIYKYNASLGCWGRAYKELTKDEGIYIPDFDWYALRKIPHEEILPWDFIEINEKQHLIKSHEKSKEF